jgi:hypothetical protein
MLEPIDTTTMNKFREAAFLGFVAITFRVPYIKQESVTIDADATRIISQMPVGEMVAAYPQLEPTPPSTIFWSIIQ